MQGFDAILCTEDSRSLGIPHKYRHGQTEEPEHSLDINKVLQTTKVTDDKLSCLKVSDDKTRLLVIANHMHDMFYFYA